ncbi:MAG: IMP cyclohydrolase [Clostridia bacterium]|nr:IMP cyclohydrolase [Clostridia bacterium]
MSVYETNSARDCVYGNSYVGRGIMIGKTEDGKKAAFAYFIMGRSANSRNRVFSEKENGEVIIYPYDYSKVEDPSLIIYSPVRVWENKVIVTNGDQTDTIYDFVKAGKTFEEALDTRCFEPDAPNWTPRISGMITLANGDFTYKMSILKSADAEGTACNRYTYSYPALKGLGHFIHTYQHDGNPIPTFCGEPERVKIPNRIDEFTSEIWENLDADNKISIYVRYIDLECGECESRMINKYSK